MSKQKLDRRESILRYANFFDWGGVIHNEPGFENGLAYASIPWALDKYEKCLGIKPNERWLLDKFLKHRWRIGGYSFPNLSRIADESDVSRSSITKYLKSLKSKGYIHKIGKRPRLLQSPYVYSVVGLYNALTFAIINNMGSNFEKLDDNDKQIAFQRNKEFIQKLPKEVKEFKTPREINQFLNDRDLVLDWESSDVFPLGEDKRPKYGQECISCFSEFESSRKDDKTCIECKMKIAEEDFFNYRNLINSKRHLALSIVQEGDSSVDHMGEQSNW